MAKIIEFPIDRPPKPFRPNSAVKIYLAQTKCNAIVRARIPDELKGYLQQEAFTSDQTLSRHICRVLTTWAVCPRELCPLCAECQKEESEEVA